jgi:hypothetical protein
MLLDPSKAASGLCAVAHSLDRMSLLGRWFTISALQAILPTLPWGDGWPKRIDIHTGAVLHEFAFYPATALPQPSHYCTGAQFGRRGSIISLVKVKKTTATHEKSRTKE